MQRISRWLIVGLLFASFGSSAHAGEISWNGFGSLYYGQSFNKDLTTTGFRGDRAEFTAFSLMGLNLAASVDNRLDFAAQIVALGNPVGSADPYALIAQWAYANFRPTDSSLIKFGRQLYPGAMASEYVRVGYLMPYRQIPQAFYLTGPFTRFDGVSAYQNFDVGIGRLSFGLLAGSPVLDVDENQLASAGISFDFKNYYGTQITLEGDGWRVRAQASKLSSKMTLGVPPAAASYSGNINAFTVGYRFDKYGIVSWGEYFSSRTPDGSFVTVTNGGRYGERGEAYYILGGYRIGKFLPRYTYAHATHNFNLPTAVSGEVSTHTAGVNYQAGRQTVVKLELERNVLDSPGTGGYYVTQTAGNTDKTFDSVFIGMDFIF